MFLVNYSFEISEKALETGYELVREKFAAAYKEKGIKKEAPPNSFTYQTSWAKGHISLAPVTEGTQITGTAERPPSTALVWVLGFVVGFFIYGLWGALIMLFVASLIYLPVDLLLGGKQRKAIGSQLCEALQGTNFHQE